MKITEYKYKPAGNWFTRLFKKKKEHRWSSERFNDIIKFVDKHIDYSQVICVSLTPDIFTVFNVMAREDGKNLHHLMRRDKDYTLFTPVPGKEIPAVCDPYVALNSNNQERCSYIMFKLENGDIAYITFDKLKLFNADGSFGW